MEIKELNERTTEDLVTLEKTLRGQILQYRFQNFTNRLDNTSLLSKTRRDIARVKTILAQRARKTATTG
ncbi:MAG: 50S ribosomal protein L29 [Polyangiaceae bacterium]